MVESRTIVSGRVVLGAPLYFDGEFIGIVSYIGRGRQDKFEIINISNNGENRKLFRIKDEFYIEEDVLLVDNEKDVFEWIGDNGLIGAGDINDGDNVFIRVRGDNKKYRINPNKTLVQYQESDLDNADTEEVIFELYSFDSRFLLPIFHQDDFSVEIFYLANISINRLSVL